ncbi:MAG TPA: rhodanese-like domain-containing protein [Anaerolineales bacterium]
MNGRKRILFVALMAIFVMSACSAQATETQLTSAPTQIGDPAYPQPSENLLQSEAEVPRVPVKEARAALESGIAVIVDVRHPDDFASSHIAGAISVPLIEIERNPASVTLDKEQWIITYCT